MDGSPVLQTDWYDPAHYHFVNRTSHVYKDGTFIKTLKPRYVNYSQTQPEYSMLHNCTAAIMDDTMLNYPWITIPCDKKFKVSYVCQYSHLRNSTPVGTAMVLNRTCSDMNWLLLRGSETCALVFDNDHSNISYLDSQYMCSLHNASLFNVNILDRIETNDIPTLLKSHLLNRLNDNAYMQRTVNNMSALNIQDMLFGRRLHFTSPQSMLPLILHRVHKTINEDAESMSFFARYNNTCSLVEYSKISLSYTSDERDAWGVKCRPCSKRINVSGVICVKPSEIKVIICQQFHFQCRDKTCILPIYKCDHVADCLDNSDENMCVYNVSDTLIDQFVTMPCSSTSECSSGTESKKHVHEICDGLYSNDTFLREEDVCVTYNHNIIIPITTKHKTKYSMFSISNTKLLMLFWYERLYRSTCGQQNNVSSGQNNYSHVNDIILQGGLLKMNSKLNDYCTFNVKKPLSSPESLLICHVVLCPGMFKCHDQFCILLSSVCDDINNCRLGEDEMMCSLFTCPGSLKCRGEKRCISTTEICDKRVNCLYSMDDELGCDKCPIICQCRGYVMSCHSNNNMFILQNGEVLYTKALVVSGTQTVMITKNLYFIGLLFLNMTSCKLEKIDVVHNKTQKLVYIIIADFHGNQLSDITFIKSDIFHRIVFLDLSFNLLHSFKYGDYFPLRHLSVLYLTGNNLIDIKMILNISQLTLIDLQYIYYTANLAIRIDHSAQVDLVVRVTDTQLCCMLQDYTKCSSIQTNTQCHGLLDTLYTRVVFYCLSTLSLCLSASVALQKILQNMLSNAISKNKKQYLVLLMNQLIANLFSSLYLVALCVVDIFRKNSLVFKTSIPCIILNAILYISIETLIVFKSGLVALIMMKILFPFQHQCAWLKWIVPITSLVWITLILTYLVQVTILFQDPHARILDKLCSIGWCVINSNINILQTLIYIVDIVSMLFCIVVFFMIYASLKSRNRKLGSLTPNRRCTASAVTCKCIFDNILEILFRVYLLTLLSTKVANLRYTYFCLYLFIFILPTNLIYSCIILFFK